MLDMLEPRLLAEHSLPMNDKASGKMWTTEEIWVKDIHNSLDYSYNFSTDIKLFQNKKSIYKFSLSILF